MNSQIKITFALLSALSFAAVCTGQEPKIKVPIHLRKSQFELTGELGEKLGTMMTLRGMVVDNYSKGYESGITLVVQKINDSATQHLIQIPFTLYFEGLGETRLPDVKPGATYTFRAYETGGFVGTPTEAYKESGIIAQTGGFVFQNELVLISGKKTAPVEWSPRDFPNQNALLAGTANNENDTAVIRASNWKLKLIGTRKWTAAETGKQAEVYGKIRPTNEENVFAVDSAEPRLVKLEDQVGQTVRLRGRAFNMNKYWWFNYRGTDLYVENMEKLPNWTVSNHSSPVEITGVLEQTDKPDLAEILLTINPGLKKYYIIRKPSWTPIAELLTPELSFDEE